MQIDHTGKSLCRSFPGRLIFIRSTKSPAEGVRSDWLKVAAPVSELLSTCFTHTKQQLSAAHNRKTSRILQG